MVRSFKAGAAALLAAALLLAASPAPGQPAGAASEAVPAPAGEAARAAFESLPEDDRSAVQDALVWTGDYSGAADGTFGRRTFEAIVAYQRRARRPPDGILDPAERAALLAAGAAARNAAGFQILSDPATGIRLGIPLRLLPRRSPTGRDGTRFQSTDGRVTLDLRAQEGDEADLRALYDRNLASPAPGRSVTYRLHRPTLFVVAGETPGGKFFTRYAAGPDGLRGVSIGYDKALAGEVDRIVVAVSNSFTPFPGPEGVMAGPTPPPRPAPAPPRRAEAQTAATGLAVAPRRVLAAAAAVEGCRELRVDGAPARLAATDGAGGLALLDLGQPHRTAPLALAADGPAPESALVVFLAPAEGGRAVATPAEILPGGRLVAALQPGAAGAVVLAPSGAILGLVTAPASGTRAVAGLNPPASHGYAGAAEIARRLGPEALLGGPVPGAQGASRGAAALAPALASVTCTPGRAP